MEPQTVDARDLSAAPSASSSDRVRARSSRYQTAPRYHFQRKGQLSPNERTIGLVCPRGVPYRKRIIDDTIPTILARVLASGHSGYAYELHSWPIWAIASTYHTADTNDRHWYRDLELDSHTAGAHELTVGAIGYADRIACADHTDLVARSGADRH